MRSKKEGYLNAGVTFLFLFAVFGCCFLLTDDFAKDGWYIKLNIDLTSGSKAINVTEYTVKELLIEIRDPDEQLIETIHWYAEDGQQSYLIPVEDQGQYGIQVTHIGEKDGDEYEVSESAAFNMQAMVITVIDIVPGFIGEINIEPGGEEPIVQFTGTWINPEYDGGGTPAKTITTDNGDGTFTAELYDNVSDTEPMAIITVEVAAQWTDSEGNHWITQLTNMGDFYLYQLTKLHSDGQILESNVDDTDYPTEIDPTGWYAIYYRVPLNQTDPAANLRGTWRIISSTQVDATPNTYLRFLVSNEYQILDATASVFEKGPMKNVTGTSFECTIEQQDYFPQFIGAENYAEYTVVGDILDITFYDDFTKAKRFVTFAAQKQ